MTDEVCLAEKARYSEEHVLGRYDRRTDELLELVHTSSMSPERLVHQEPP